MTNEDKNITLEIKEKKEIIKEEDLDLIEKKINNNFENDENKYINDLLNENIDNTLFGNKKVEINDNQLENKINDIVKNLKENIVHEYSVTDVKNTFMKMSHSAILVQIINNKLYYLEKKCEDNKNNFIINILHDMINKFLINDTTFIIDTNNEIQSNENYVLRFNKSNDNNNLLLVNYNFDYDINIRNIDWHNKKDMIYINENFISKELYGKLKYELDKDNYFLSKEINHEELNEYKYVLFEETIDTIQYEVDLLRINTIMIKLDDNKDKLQTFYSKYLNENNYFLKFEITNISEIYNNLNEFKKNINNVDCVKIIDNLLKIKSEIFSEEVIDNYMKNIISRLSLKCFTEQIVNNRIFITNKENSYIYNRIEFNDNKFDFYFQGKDFELMIKDKENKINILVNEFTTNIFYNGNNIFNFRIPNLVSNLFSSNYTFVIRNNQLFIYKNKTTLMVKCALPSIFNIDILAIRTFNKDSWWIC